MERTKGILAAFGIAMAICSIWLISLSKTRSAEKLLNQEKLKTEALLSEKLQTEKSLERTRNQVTALSADNNILHDKLQQKDEYLALQASKYNALKKDILNLKSQYASEVEKREHLEKSNTLASKKHIMLTSEKNKLQDSLQVFAQQNEYLKDQLDEAILRSIDQTIVTPLKRNDRRLTAKARATKQLVARVHVPSELNDMTFTVEGPQGIITEDQRGTITSRIVESPEQNVTASIRNLPPSDVHTKTVEIVYSPKKKLKGGVYVIKIFDGRDYIGSMKVKLM